MGFTLRIINAPPSGTHWSAHFWSEEEGRFISPSPTPTIDEVWNCPFNPYGAPEGLRILVLDFVHAETMLDVDDLGPIYDGKSYIFDCSTRRLSEEIGLGFTLGIVNAPAGAVLWNANFAEKSLDYDPIADSGWLGVGESWVYPSNPLGCTTLHIWILDAQYNVLLDVYNLGPVNDGKDYTYDCSTGILGEVAEVVPCEITIDAPDSAQEGEKVSVSALLKNVSSISIMYKTEIYAVPDLFPDFRIGTIEKNINSGSTFTAYGSFTMPASNTTVFVWVERWSKDHWVYDNSASRVVSLEVVPEFAGKISKKELEYDETRGAIPVY